MANEALVALENVFRKKVRNDQKIQHAFLRIHSEKHEIDLQLAEGALESGPMHPEQPFFIASIDKLFTAVEMAKFVEEGKLSFDDFISSYLEPDLLHGLHRIDGKEYTDEIQIKHLLNHTSGLFGDAMERPADGETLLDLLLDESTEPLTPHKILQWAKENLQTKYPPGEKFSYSDIGYYLLILILEKISATPYRELLTSTLFEPLGMEQTHFLPLQKSAVNNNSPVAPCYLSGKNIARNVRLGMDDVGGRIVSTTGDLLRFMKALVRYDILRKETVEQMKDWAKFSVGIQYGYGMMNFKHVPLLMPRKYRMWGNAGSNGSFLFYHPELDTYFIGSLNQFGSPRKGIMLIFKMIDTLLKHTDSSGNRL